MGDNFKNIKSTSGNINIATRKSKISSDYTSPKGAIDSKILNVDHKLESKIWYKRALEKVFIGVLVVILGSFSIWVINKYTVIGL